MSACSLKAIAPMGNWPRIETNVHYMFRLINHHRSWLSDRSSASHYPDDPPLHFFLLLMSSGVNDSGNLGDCCTKGGYFKMASGSSECWGLSRIWAWYGACQCWHAAWFPWRCTWLEILPCPDSWTLVIFVKSFQGEMILKTTMFWWICPPNQFIRKGLQKRKAIRSPKLNAMTRKCMSKPWKFI